jgi:hypothetical protein
MHGLGARHTQIQTLKQLDDVAIGINTSSNSPNVIEAMKKAKKQHLKNHWSGPLRLLTWPR